jgi:hypothetical protein
MPACCARQISSVDKVVDEQATIDRPLHQRQPLGRTLSVDAPPHGVYQVALLATIASLPLVIVRPSPKPASATWRATRLV